MSISEEHGGAGRLPAACSRPAGAVTAVMGADGVYLGMYSPGVLPEGYPTHHPGDDQPGVPHQPANQCRPVLTR